jgi:hypothetical protein
VEAPAKPIQAQKQIATENNFPMFVSPPLMVRVLIMGKPPEKMEDRLGKIPGKNHSDKIDFRWGKHSVKNPFRLGNFLQE